MPINFPSSPTNGQTYTYNNVLYTYDLAATKWTANNTASLVQKTGDTMTGALNVPAGGGL